MSKSITDTFIVLNKKYEPISNLNQNNIEQKQINLNEKIIQPDIIQSDIIQPDYFESDANVWLLEIVLNHFRDYKCPPSKDVLKVKITDLFDSPYK